MCRLARRLRGLLLIRAKTPKLTLCRVRKSFSHERNVTRFNTPCMLD